jgi:hypothetical protein
MVREIAIWISGMFAGGIIGGLIGSHFTPPDAIIHWGFWGVLAGIFAFVCLRLWLGDRAS